MATDEEESRVSFTLKEMLERVERALDQISAKLDQKADSSRVLVLEGKVYDIERRGSDQAREALDEVHHLNQRVQKLESESATELAVAKNTKDIEQQASNIRFAMWAGIVATGGLIIELVVSFMQMAH